MGFNHEKLNVYQRTLPFNAKVNTWVGQWDSKHAICDHLPRAAGSMTESIAMASASYSAMKQRSLDFAIGSTLECAACLDLAGIKRLLDEEIVPSAKGQLSEILRMLMGLRRAWSTPTREVREEGAEYGDASAMGGIDEACDNARDEAVGGRLLFHHEQLDVYRVALMVAQECADSEEVGRLSLTAFRRVDELLTSMVLNIAEGNGRFSQADQRRFLGTSHEAAIKLAARLDLYAIQGMLSTDGVDGWKALLERVAVMSASMSEGRQ